MSYASGLYVRSPLLVQNALISVKGAQFRFVRSSERELRSFSKRLEKSSLLTAEEIVANRDQLLVAHLENALVTVPYYRSLLERSEISKIEDGESVDQYIRRWPILLKTDVRGSEEQFLSDAVARRSLRQGHTSGTTGTPLTTYETAGSMARRLAFVVRLRMWAGIDNPLFPSRAQFTGRDIALSDGPYWRHNLPGRARLYSTAHMSKATAPDYLENLHQLQPTLIDGYPSALLILARLAASLDMSLPSPTAIITSAETLPEADRQELSDAYACPVFDQYAMSEPSCFWSSCSEGGLHIHTEYGYSEILDESGRPVEPGEWGSVVVTSILNDAFMLIRYNTGDTAQRAVAECECELPYPTVGAVGGRRDDVLTLPTGELVGRLDPIYKGLSGIVESQIVQESRDQVTVKVVPGLGYSQKIQQLLVKNLRTKVGGDIQITVELVDDIARGPNGKLRSVVSLVADA